LTKFEGSNGQIRSEGMRVIAIDC